MNITIDLKGQKELMAKLKRLENPSNAIYRGVDNFITDEKGAIEKYAPLSQANRKPGINGYSWYVRADGTQTITGKRYENSDDMINKWDYKITRVSGGVRATIKNTAKYSGFVIGKKQAWFHKKRGWVNVPEHFEKRQDRLLSSVSKEIDVELNR